MLHTRKLLMKHKTLLGGVLLGTVTMWTLVAYLQWPSFNNQLLSPDYLLDDSELLSPIEFASQPLPIDTTLLERLAAWEESPGGIYDTETNLTDFLEWNKASCKAREFHMLQGYEEVWKDVTEDDVGGLRTDVIEYLRETEASGEMKHVGSGRGIVFVAGQSRTFALALWSSRLLRKQGTTLPIHVYHFQDEHPSSEELDRFKEVNVTVLPVPGIEKGPNRDTGDEFRDSNSNFHLKAWAVIKSPFREVLSLDADVMVIRDPTYMFDGEGYKRLGALFMPDYWRTSRLNPIWSILGLPCREEMDFESSVYLVDKGRHLDVLHIAAYMQVNHDVWYNYSGGDKDTFRWAFLALRKRWAVPGRFVQVGGYIDEGETEKRGMCGHTMIQHDEDGVPLFLHANILSKYMVDERMQRGRAWGRSMRLKFSTSASTIPGGVDCDMLADADENGEARAPAVESVMQRAFFENGMKLLGAGSLCYAIGWDLDGVEAVQSSSADPVEIIEWAHDQDFKGVEDMIFDVGYGRF